nr:MAG TPA: hypothetical protein [Caudoviricetes sp.]
MQNDFNTVSRRAATAALLILFFKKGFEINAKSISVSGNAPVERVLLSSSRWQTMLRVIGKQ